jgi:dihydroorotate dehydrogenase (NAD+) catalytic subunit
LSNPGVQEQVSELREVLPELRALGVPLVASIFADSVEAFGVLAELVADADPDLIELNISCPNVEDVYGEPFSANPRSAAAVVDRVKAVTRVPVAVKLSPNVPDIAQIARAVEWAGADAITAVNTLGPGMVIDVELGLPILANVAGGVSGPALRPIAVRCVYEIYRAVGIPIIGTGGISGARDAVEIMMAGATAVGVGSAVYYKGVDVFAEIVDGLSDFMVRHGLQDVNEIIGIAHRGGLRAAKAC